MPETKQPQDDPAQSQRFIDMAREVGAGQKPAEFDRVLTHVLREAPLKESHQKRKKAVAGS